jgi:hypothetical protein
MEIHRRIHLWHRMQTCITRVQTLTCMQSQGAAIASDEKERTPTEPAALGQPSLQLDALFLVLTAVAASGTPPQQPHGTTTAKLLRLRQFISRISKAVLASRPTDMPRSKPKSRWKFARLRSPPAVARRLPPLTSASAISLQRPQVCCFCLSHVPVSWISNICGLSL